MEPSTIEKQPQTPNRRPVGAKEVVKLDQHVVEIISDSGEGAQRCGQSFGAIAARVTR